MLVFCDNLWRLNNFFYINVIFEAHHFYAYSLSCIREVIRHYVRIFNEENLEKHVQILNSPRNMMFFQFNNLCYLDSNTFDLTHL